MGIYFCLDFYYFIFHTCTSGSGLKQQQAETHKRRSIFIFYNLLELRRTNFIYSKKAEEKENFVSSLLHKVVWIQLNNVCKYNIIHLKSKGRSGQKQHINVSS